MGREKISSIDELKIEGDTLLSQMKSGVGVLGMKGEKKPSVVVVVTQDLIKNGIKAGDIAKKIGALMGGGGGGKPHLATAGGQDNSKLAGALKKATDIPDEDRDFYLERRYPAFGNLVPRDVASRAAKERTDAGCGVAPTGLGVFLDFSYAIKRLGKDVIEARYGNLFDMYEEITDVNAYEYPMMIYPAIHYTMGGLWVDYELQSNIPGLFVGGEANFSDHGANRLGASALMQGLSDGYFVLP